jgi:hypothetical protein
VPGLDVRLASVAAVARMIAGASGWLASSSRPGKAAAPCVSPACRVVPYCGRSRQALPYHLSMALAAHCGFLSVWHWVQAFGLPSDSDRSGRGTRML